MSQYNPNIHHRRSIRLKGYDYAQAGLYFITICCQDRMCRFGTVQNGEMVLNDLGMIAHEEWVKLAERFPNFELDVFQIMPNHMHGIIVLNHVGAGFTSDQNDEITPNLSVADIGAGFTPNQNGETPQNHAVNKTGKNVGAGFTPALNDEITQNLSIADIGAGFTPDQNDEITQNLSVADIGAGFTSAQNDEITQNLSVADIGAGFTPDQNDEITPNLSVADIGAGASPAPTVFDIVGAYKSLVSNRCLSIYKSKNVTMGKLWQRNYWEHIIRNEQSYQTISQYIIRNPAKWQEDKFYVS